MVYFNVD